jgi:hypothetical protein
MVKKGSRVSLGALCILWVFRACCVSCAVVMVMVVLVVVLVVLVVLDMAAWLSSCAVRKRKRKSKRKLTDDIVKRILLCAKHGGGGSASAGPERITSRVGGSVVVSEDAGRRRPSMRSVRSSLDWDLGLGCLGEPRRRRLEACATT